MKSLRLISTIKKEGEFDGGYFLRRSQLEVPHRITIMCIRIQKIKKERTNTDETQEFL